METVYTEVKNGLTINIMPDIDSGQSPDDWGDRGAFIVAYHRDFDVRRDKIIQECDLREYFGNGVQIEQLGRYHILPLSAYIHSQVKLYRGTHKVCAWDSCQVGAILLDKVEFKLLKTAESFADGLLRDWNNYLSGNVYGFEILYKDGESLESCWGYYGDYDAKDGVLDEARDCVDGLTNDGETDPNGQFKMIFEQEATK